jgi:hypothetical protein
MNAPTKQVKFTSEKYYSMSKNLSEGMDACDKAAELYKCGREKAPDLLAGVMVNIEIGLTVMAYFCYKHAMRCESECHINILGRASGFGSGRSNLSNGLQMRH